jgi:CheY-like chemotaxis protein
MSSPNLRNCFIVYLEDDPASRKVMSLIFEKAIGIQTYVIFENSANFMEKLGKLVSKPDIFLLDIHVAPQDGFEVLQMLRNDPLYHTAIVIALTASVMNEEVDKLRAAGFNGAISKPIDHRHFPNLLERIHNGEAVWSIS